MKCALCDRSMIRAAVWAAGYPVGPKCARRAGLLFTATHKPAHKPTHKPSIAARIEDGQLDLFTEK